MNIKTWLDNLYLECEHGDEEHRQWLKNKFEDYYNRKSIWNNTVSNLPETGVEVMGYNLEWEEEDETSDGIRICFLSDLGYWTICVWNNYQDCYSEYYTKEYYSEDEIKKIEYDYGEKGSCVSSIKIIQEPPTKWMYKIDQ